MQAAKLSKPSSNGVSVSFCTSTRLTFITKVHQRYLDHAMACTEDAPCYVPKVTKLSAGNGASFPYLLFDIDLAKPIDLHCA